MLQFTFSEVEAALAYVHDIADVKRNAFRARLQHLQKLRFPAGLNTGRGRAATYSVGHIFLLGVALELLQIGLNPERAKRVIEEDLHTVAMAASMAAQNHYSIRERKFEHPAFLYCDPAALRDLTKIYQEQDWASQTFFYAGIATATEYMRESFVHGMQRLAFISVSALVYDLALCTLPKTRFISTFCDELAQWADPFIHNVDYDLDEPNQPYWDTIDRMGGDDGDT